LLNQKTQELDTGGRIGCLPSRRTGGRRGISLWAEKGAYWIGHGGGLPQRESCDVRLFPISLSRKLFFTRQLGWEKRKYNWVRTEGFRLFNLLAFGGGGGGKKMATASI